MVDIIRMQHHIFGIASKTIYQEKYTGRLKASFEKNQEGESLAKLISCNS